MVAMAGDTLTMVAMAGDTLTMVAMVGDTLIMVAMAGDTLIMVAMAVKSRVTMTKAGERKAGEEAEGISYLFFGTTRVMKLYVLCLAFVLADLALAGDHREAMLRRATATTETRAPLGGALRGKNVGQAVIASNLLKNKQNKFASNEDPTVPGSTISKIEDPENIVAAVQSAGLMGTKLVLQVAPNVSKKEVAPDVSKKEVAPDVSKKEVSTPPPS
eukprot:Stramenopile-MAST_4_protein_5631